MQREKLINRIFAGLAFLLSFIVYLRTIAPTTSFWDCGEFITCSYILGIPHPPGAPFYLLLGRIFSMLPLAADIGLRVNLISALSSSLTVMFLYLIIVRLIKRWRGEPKSAFDMVMLVASGMIGALAFAFTDSFWFNAVEAEVYAISMTFTSSIIYLILLWLEKADSPSSDRYLLFIAYLLGLAIAVHLLMILALPAVFMVIYFRYLNTKQRVVTLKRFAGYVGFTLLVLLLTLAVGLSSGIPFVVNLGITVAILVATALLRKERVDRISFRNYTFFLLLTGAAFGIIYPGIVQFVPYIAGHIGSFGFPFLILVILGLAFGVSHAVVKKHRLTSLALMSVLLIVAGYTTYTMIYLRSNLNPAVDENDPETLSGMVSYLNREQYGTWSTLPRRFNGLPPDWQFEYEHQGQNYETFNFSKQMKFMVDYQINKLYWRYFGWQFIGRGTTIGADGFIAELFSVKGLWALPFLLGIIGMIHHFVKHWKFASVILALFFLTGLAIVIYLNQENPQPRERDYVFVGSFFAFAVWIGIGVTAALEWVEEKFRNKFALRNGIAAVLILAFILAAPINLLAFNYKTHDRNGDFVAYDYSYNILQTCEPNAIVFTNGDNDTFPLWFLQYVYNVRTDVRVVNLSLLNTPWYIKQLKHQEPRVPMSMTDKQIDKLEIKAWKKTKVEIPIPANMRPPADMEEFVSMEKGQVQDTSLTLMVEPTVFGQALRIQDIMVLNIVLANQWQKPIYYAVTVSDQNKLNMDDYLRMDGLDFKLIPGKAEKIDAQRLENNLFNVFQYRNLNNPDVYFNDNIVGLLQNYRAAFLRLAHQHLMDRNNEGVIRVLDKMSEVLPFEVIPAPDMRLPLQVGQYYQFAGKPEKFLSLAQYVYKQQPDDPEVVGVLVSLLQREGKYEEALQTLNSWQTTHPEDPEAKKKIEELDFLISDRDSLGK